MGGFGVSPVDTPARWIAECFTAPHEQLEMVRALSNQNGWEFGEDDFPSIEDVPRIPIRPDVAVVLDIRLPTPSDTLAELACAAGLIHPDDKANWRLTEDQIRVLPGAVHERGLGWKALNLAANLGAAARSVRSPERSPHSALLSALVVHPGWRSRVDGKYIPCIQIPGYQLRENAEMDWIGVSGVSSSSQQPGACMLHILPDTWESIVWAVPEYFGA